MTQPGAEENEALDEEEASDTEAAGSEDEDVERVRRALEELTTLPEDRAEALILELLEAVEKGDLPLSCVLGYTDDDLYGIYEKAYNLYKGGRAKNAVPICEALLALNPGLPAALLLLAGCLMDLRQYARALKVVDEVLAVDAEEPEAHLKRAHVLFRLGRLEEAAAALQAVLELDSEAASEEAQEANRILEHVRDLLHE
jgi:tetratricopeptide (TPR) repeat protein